MAKKRAARVAEPKAEPAKIAWMERMEDFIRRYSVAVFLVLVGVASLRIAATYTVFNHTIDEPAHIACGMEWLDQKTYHYETQHPPLARVMTAIGPYLDGAHSWRRPDKYNEGAAILYTDNHYDRTLAFARRGVLPCFWVVYLWARRSYGEPAAAFATLCFTFLPAVLAHGGLATTDMALTATLGAALLTMLMWLENPSWSRSAIFGAALASAILSKFSTIAFFPSAVLAAAVCYLAFERPSPARITAVLKTHLLPLAFAAVVAIVIIWAGYRFSFAKVPAPELFAGIEDVMQHNRVGHPAYLLGKFSETGFWYYYPVVLGVKTPLAVLSLLAIGITICWRRRKDASAYWVPLSFAAGILAFSAFSNINIGVRHVLPVYLTFSMVAGLGAQRLWSAGKAARWVLGALTFWMVATSGLAHPDYLPYFNALASDQPDKIEVDSDLDWGQDMKRLGARLREVGAPEVAFDPFIVAHLEAVHGFPPIKPFQYEAPAPGWNAASLTMLKIARRGSLWTDRIPAKERVGKGVLLWYFPPQR
jgi:4-amino-4-deoxy-L-arabinose transferase-like glycosyltransferase